MKFNDKLFKRWTTLLVAMYFLALNYNLFILPNNLVLGGVSGLAVIFKNIINPSLFILILNFILIMGSYFILGKREAKASIVGSLLFPIFIYLTANVNEFINIFSEDMILIIIVSAVINGISIGLIIKNGFNTGGTDIAASIMSKLNKRTIGSSLFIIDGLIIILGFITFGIIKTMYAVIFVYIFSVIVDKIILGISDNKAFYIISENESLVKEYIMNNLNSGVTILSARGGFDETTKNVIFCVLPTRNYYKLKDGIMKIDNKAFFIVTDAYEVRGGA